MKKYNLRIEITDNDLEDVTILERNSDDHTWIWMANAMFDALRGASFILPENIDFPSIDEMLEDRGHFDEEDSRSDEDGLLSDGGWDAVYGYCVKGYGGTD